MKKFLTLLLTLCIMVSLTAGFTFPVNASDSFVYDPAKAVEYAVAHWNDGVGVCDQFVKACLKAAGIEILAGDVDPVKNALVDAGYGTLSELTLAADGVHITQSDNPGVKAGDFMFYYCGVCGDCAHTAIITGFDENGNVKVAAHNPGVNDYVAHGGYKHTGDDGVKHEGGNRYYVVHMTTAPVHNHSFVSDQYETAHPHAMFASCACGAKYYLGWTATVKTCTSCVPPVGDAPYLTAVELEEGGVSLSWTPVDDVVTYEVHRAKSANGTYFKLYEKMAASFTNGSVDPGQTYYYKVKAVRANDADSVYSNVVSVTISGGNEIPVVTVTENEDGSIKISWTPVGNVETYEVYRAKTEGGTYTLLSSTTATSLTNSSVVNGQTYYYKVKAVREDDSQSVYSDVVSITKSGGLDNPVVTVTENEDGSVLVKWTQVAEAINYIVYRAKSIDGTYFEIGNTQGTSITNKSVEAGLTYYYKVKAVRNPDTNSGYSEVVSITLSNASDSGETALMGDADGNGTVDMFDAKMVLEHYAGLDAAKNINLSVSDVDNNDVVDMFDAKMILEYYAGIITQFPAET